jgi:KAP family P-loop domain
MGKLVRRNPPFPTIPESSRFDSELEALCLFAAWVGTDHSDEAPVTFSAMLVAFLAGADPVSQWFQRYTDEAIRDSLFKEHGMTNSSVKLVESRATLQGLPAQKFPFSRSTVQLLEAADAIAKLTADKSSRDGPFISIGTRHVMSAFAFTPPPGHAKELTAFGFDLADWQTRLIEFLRTHYPTELWNLLLNPHAGRNPSDMTVSDVAAQVPTNINPSTPGRNPNRETAGTAPAFAQSSSPATSRTTSGEGTVTEETPADLKVSTDRRTTGSPNSPKEPDSLPSSIPPPLPPQKILASLVGRYTADDPDATADDLLDIDAEAAGFARIVAAASIMPPLAIGIFGEWGSGKTYFMRRIQSRVDTLRRSQQAKGPAPLFYSDIVQIRFNAWHYIETNLWASLVEYIFSALDTWIQTQAGDDPKRTDLVFNRLATAQQLQIDALEKVVQLRARQHSAELRAKRAHQDYAAALAKSAGLKPDASLRAMLRTFLNSDATATANLKSISKDLGLPELRVADERLNTVLAEARTTTGHARLVVQSLLTKLGTRRGFLAIACIILAFPVFSVLLGALANELPRSYGPIIHSFATHTALTLLVAAGILQSALSKAKAALNKLSVFDAHLQKSIDNQIKTAKESREAKISFDADQDLLRCQQAMAAADGALNEANLKLAAARQEFESGTARARLNAFVRAKVTDGEYAKHLGIIASIRKDFVQLASLMHAANDSKDEATERQKLHRESILRVQRFLDWLKSEPDIRLTGAEVRSLFALLEPMEATQQFEQYREVIIGHFEDSTDSLDAIMSALVESKDTPVPHFSRIVLYVDDLDRCPPAKVVDVLQAVHLLLCFPLFVVIVAVDARWVSRALHEHFPNLLADTPFSETSAKVSGPAVTNGATSDDYLEKIFQIPYWVRPMGATAAATYVREIAEVDRVPPPPPADPTSEMPGMIPSVAPMADPASANPAGAEGVPAPLLRPSDPVAPVPVRPPESANSTATTDLAIGMSLTEWEIAALRAFAPYVGRTPRHAIRFVNIYRLIKTSLSGQTFDAADLEQGATAKSRALIAQLAIVTGAPYAAPHYFHYLQQADAAQPAQAFISQLGSTANGLAWAADPTIKGVFEELLARENALTATGLLKVEDLQYVAPTVQRYSFTARLAYGPDRIVTVNP